MDKECHERVAADENTGDTARRRRQIASRFNAEATDNTITGNGACRLHFATRAGDEDGAWLQTDSGASMCRHTLHRLAEALPRVLDLAAGSSMADRGTGRGSRNFPFARRGRS